MKCYFCQQAFAHHFPLYPFHQCFNCQKQYDLHHVSTVLDEETYLFAHIYITSPDYCIMPAPISLGETVQIEIGHKFHIRLHLKENFTTITDNANSKYIPISKLTGFPINPANAKQKLKTILTFS